MVLGFTLTIPLWLPGVVRALVPSRYIVAYAPEPLQRMIFDSDPLQVLPTAQPSTLDPAGVILPTPLPTIAAPPTGALPTAPPSGDTHPTPTALPTSSGPTVQLRGFTHIFQGWNNCGPATLAMALSYWGAGVSQNDVAAFVKPNPEDRNVRPDELIAYANSIGLAGTVRINGSIDLLKSLIAAGYPVIVEKGFDPEPERLGWMGHYLLLTGYSEGDQVFYTMDSYLGPDQEEPFDHMDRFWRHFNRTYLVFYPPERAAEVAAVIGADIDDATMYANALYRANLEREQYPDDPFTWFNLGSIYAAIGDFESAAVAFDLARERGTPWRMLWYQFGPYEAYLHVGGNRLYDVTTLAGAVLVDNVYSEEAYYYRGLAYQALGSTEAARWEFQKAIMYNEHYTAAYAALQALGG
jgi:tetratricopeptide (TPR) repeat protein